MHAHSVMLKPELSSVSKNWSATFWHIVMHFIQVLRTGDKVVVTSKIMLENIYPCRGITHSTGGEMSNLIFRGEDLLLGDHGQPYQTLRRDKRDARRTTWRPAMSTLWLTLEQHMMEGSWPWALQSIFFVSFQQNFPLLKCLVFFDLYFWVTKCHASPILLKIKILIILRLSVQ